MPPASWPPKTGAGQAHLVTDFSGPIRRHGGGHVGPGALPVLATLCPSQGGSRGQAHTLVLGQAESSGQPMAFLGFIPGRSFWKQAAGSTGWAGSLRDGAQEDGWGPRQFAPEQEDGAGFWAARLHSVGSGTFCMPPSQWQRLGTQGGSASCGLMKMQEDSFRVTELIS